MKAKQIIFGLLACVALLVVACEPSSTASEDELYEGIDKTRIKVPTNGIDKTRIKVPTNG